MLRTNTFCLCIKTCMNFLIDIVKFIFSSEQKRLLKAQKKAQEKASKEAAAGPVVQNTKKAAKDEEIDANVRL